MKIGLRSCNVAVLLLCGILAAGCQKQIRTSNSVPPPPGSSPSDRPMSVPSEVMESHVRSVVPPLYPPEALKKGLGGVVKLRCVITKTGAVANLRVVSSSDPVFTDAAVRAVQQWKYHPYKFEGRPVDVDTMIRVVFDPRK